MKQTKSASLASIGPLGGGRETADLKPTDGAGLRVRAAVAGRAMARSIRIDFQSSGRFTRSRIRNFVEELKSTLAELGHSSLKQEINPPVVTLDVEGNAGRYRAIVMRLLDKHMLAGNARITVL